MEITKKVKRGEAKSNKRIYQSAANKFPPLDKISFIQDNKA